MHFPTSGGKASSLLHEISNSLERRRRAALFWGLARRTTAHARSNRNTNERVFVGFEDTAQQHEIYNTQRHRSCFSRTPRYSSFHSSSTCDAHLRRMRSPSSGGMYSMLLNDTFRMMSSRFLFSGRFPQDGVARGTKQTCRFATQISSKEWEVASSSKSTC